MIEFKCKDMVGESEGNLYLEKESIGPEEIFDGFLFVYSPQDLCKFFPDNFEIEFALNEYGVNQDFTPNS